MTTNQRIQTILNRQMESGRLSHAYLLVGPKGTEKKSLAKEFAEKVLGLSSLVDLLKHPDYAVLDCSEDASAENVREFIGRIALKPFVAKRKFALISNIENLNSQGANALLKTLEEPPENTIMVLTADTRKILPTVLSRCQVFSINRGVHVEERSPATGQKVREAGPGIKTFAGQALSERLLAINRFADLEEQDLKQEIENFVYESAGRLSQAPEKYTQLAAGLKAYEDLGTNKNRKLVLQGLFMKI